MGYLLKGEARHPVFVKIDQSVQKLYEKAFLGKYVVITGGVCAYTPEIPAEGLVTAVSTGMFNGRYSEDGSWNLELTVNGKDYGFDTSGVQPHNLIIKRRPKKGPAT